ncbi:MAG TPA: molybdenum cofactor biosynthesis protein MoaE [Bacteroidia bacterium]|nr:molybdenum cofactor biosynthesis protein MoaE [Bacteroidia bacterium]
MKEDWFNFSFVKGPVSSEQIAKRITSHQTEIHAGAYNIFLGQVRADKIEGKKVEGIDYTTKEEMASVVFKQISEDAKKNYELFSVDILHSTGPVMAGEICLMVLVTCGHRKESFDACEYIVERLKKEVPIWGRELMEDQTHSWKINK